MTAFVTTVPTTGHAYDADGNIRPVDVVCAERVANGQRVLTEYFSTIADPVSADWREQVNTDRLSMDDAWSCVLGQTFDGYGNGEVKLFIDADADDDTYSHYIDDHKANLNAVLHGFLSMPHDTARHLMQCELRDWFGHDAADSYLQQMYYDYLESAWRNELTPLAPSR